MTFEPRPYDLLSPPAPVGKEAAAHPSSAKIHLARAGAWLARHNERHRQRLMLRMLDDRMLSDIGLSRADVSSESAKWPWQL
ncbi:MAG: DUF1127 domain-containing protein [Dongiaceae bacterium]